MSSRWSWFVRQLVRRIWFRAALFSIVSVFLAILAVFVAPFVPDELGARIGSDAVDNILAILASSMLAVTTFSLTAMVSAFAGASNTITPRAAQLLVRDTTAQNALSTFLGGFLFSIVGICALSTGLYGKSGRAVLFIGTICVIAIIAFTLLRWIEHLSGFGRVGNTIDRVERVTKDAVENCALRIQINAKDKALETGGHRVYSTNIGYITHIDIHALNELSKRLDCAINVLVSAGAFVTPQRPIVNLSESDAKADEKICDAFTIEHHREFDHDPRFGLVVLAEIASRALSPAVNDPGTAIAVLGSSVRIMAALFTDKRAETIHAQETGRVHMPALLLEDLLDDLIQPIARDGAGLVEVAIRVQRTIGQIAALAPDDARGTFRSSAYEALARSEKALALEADFNRVRSTFQTNWGN